MVRFMLFIKKHIRRLVENSRVSMRRQVLLLVLASGLAAFLTALVLFGGTMVRLKGTVAQEEEKMEEAVGESVGDFAGSWDKMWLEDATEHEADYIARELTVNGEDVEFLADSLHLLLKSRSYYGERQLPSSREEPNIASGMPYIHFSPGVAADRELAEEISKVANFADVLLPMSRSYKSYHTSLFAASRKGYMICVDILPRTPGGSIYASDEQREIFVTTYEPRQRPWYKKAQEQGGLIYTSAFEGGDGFLEMACAAPYYDENGFAGVVGIGTTVEDLQRQVSSTVIGDTGISFAMDETGNMVFSSRETGILAAGSGNFDLREAEEPTLAEAARRMLAGENDVMQVRLEGEEYYLAFAPIKSLGWSYGTLVSTELLQAPVQHAKSLVRREMDGFQNIIDETFARAALKGLLLLLPLIFIASYASGAVAARLTRPIRLLADGVREIAAGNLDKKLDIRTGNELEHLAICFNSMTEELKEQIQRLSEAAAKEERARTELEVAARIQAGMLPAALQGVPFQDKFDLSAFMNPAREVGGDFYDFYFVSEDTLAITVADVSDKGVPASLFMVIAKTLLKDHALLQGPEKLARAVAEANDKLVQSNQAFMFVTVFTGLLHLPTGKFTYVNAGHNPPLICRGGGPVYLPKAKNPVLGVMGGMELTAETLTLRPGEAIFLYTDGVTEAMNAEGGFFGEARLQENLQGTAGCSAADMVARVQQAVHGFTADFSQSDDITMMALVYR